MCLIKLGAYASFIRFVSCYHDKLLFELFRNLLDASSVYSILHLCFFIKKNKPHNYDAGKAIQTTDTGSATQTPRFKTFSQ